MSAQLRVLEEKSSSLPAQLSRAQVAAILRCFENPLRRTQALEGLMPRLDLSAERFADELAEAVWPNDIRRLCGDLEQ